MVIHEPKDYTKILNSEHVYGMPVRQSRESFQRYNFSIIFPHVIGNVANAFKIGQSIKVGMATHDYTLFADSNLPENDLLQILSEARTGLDPNEFNHSLVVIPYRDLNTTIYRSLGGNCPEGTILAVDDPTRASPAALPTLALNSYKYPFTQRHKELHQIWNAQTHVAFNEHREQLLDLVAQTEICDESAILTEGFKLYLQQIFAQMPDIIRPTFTQEEEFNNFAQTFNRFTPQILSENADFIPVVMVRLLEKIMYKKNRVNPIPFGEWPDHINWDGFSTVFKEFAKGINGSLGGRADQIHNESVDVTFNRTTKKWEYKMSKLQHEWIQGRMKYQTLYAQNLQIFTDALSKHAGSIAITNPNGGILNASQRGCPVLPVNGIPEGGIHTFDVLIEVAQAALQKFIKESAYGT